MKLLSSTLFISLLLGPVSIQADQTWKKVIKPAESQSQAQQRDEKKSDQYLRSPRRERRRRRQSQTFLSFQCVAKRVVGYSNIRQRYYGSASRFESFNPRQKACDRALTQCLNDVNWKRKEGRCTI